MHCLAIDPGGKILASASRESNAVELWEVETGRLLKTLSDHAGVVCSVDFSPCGKWLAAGGQFGELRIWDSTTYEPIELDGHSRSVTLYSIDFRALVCNAVSCTSIVAYFGVAIVKCYYPE